MQQPKNINKSYKTRNTPVGRERRLNMTKQTLDKQPHFPKAVTYADIDQCVFDWVDKQLDLTYMGQKLPTYKLFSFLRLAEYVQMWEKIDEKGNIDANFKILTRENNPQHGENQGNNYNIPGEREYIIFKTEVAEEKGDEVTQIYTMKQPMSVNLVYKVNIVTTSFELLNTMNTKIQKEFKGLEKYIFPNGFAMPMMLDSVSDESDYTIDDKKYYGQSYQIKVVGFIIEENDYNVRKIPSRKRVRFVSGMNRPAKKQKYDIGQFIDYSELEKMNVSQCSNEIKLSNTSKEIPFEELYNPIKEESQVTIEDFIGNNVCWAGTDDEMIVNKKVVITVPISVCNNSAEFELDCDLELETVQLNNAKNLKLYLNGGELSLEEADISFISNDKIKIVADVKDITQEGSVALVCYDTHSIVDEVEDITL